MFLTRDELNSIIDLNLIGKIVADNDAIVDTIISESIEMMKSYLSKHYDSDAIFLQENNSRNLNVLKKLKDIVVYELYTRNPRAMNEVAEKKYVEAVNWLEKLNTGEFADKSLPVPNPDIEPVEMSIRSGSNPKYTSNF
jgi:phage gp36-like protein